MRSQNIALNQIKKMGSELNEMLKDNGHIIIRTTGVAKYKQQRRQNIQLAQAS